MLSKYIRIVRRKVKEFENKDINGNCISTKRLVLKKIIFTVTTLILSFFLKNGLPDSFLNYCATVLSIFIGLFMNILIFISDKFPVKKSAEEINAKEELKKKQLFNFYKKFSYIIGYTIILSVFCLILIFSLMITDNTFNPFEYSLSTNITIESILLFIRCSINLLIKFLILYWLLKIFYYTLLAVASLTNTINLKNDIK